MRVTGSAVNVDAVAAGVTLQQTGATYNVKDELQVAGVFWFLTDN